MKIHNELPLLKTCLSKWEKKPSKQIFEQDYLFKMNHLLSPMLEDFSARLGSFYDVVEGLHWQTYRDATLPIDVTFEEQRLRKHIKQVETLLGVTLGGEAVLFGAFTAMDGYARFERGTHRVFLGVDENHGRGAYLDVLLTHELTHVAREASPEVWTGWGLNPKMTHDEFTEHLPVVEHLMNEGYSCVVSEILNPNEQASNYVYQTSDSLAHVYEHGPAIDKLIHEELAKPDGGDYGRLYDVSQYKPPIPRYGHYVWAWQWVKHLLKTKAQGDVRKLRNWCSRDLVEDALSFELKPE